jgi:hypothetical protein
MAFITQSINIAFTTTSSVNFAAPVQQISLLDSTNFQFLRQVLVSNDGVKVIRGNYAIQVPMSQLFYAAFQAYPSMSWAPIIETDVTSSQYIRPYTQSLATASISFFVSDEFTTDLSYQWYVSSSITQSWQLPTGSNYYGTSSATLSASYNSGSNGEVRYFYCESTNPAGATTSSISTVTFIAP